MTISGAVQLVSIKTSKARDLLTANNLLDDKNDTLQWHLSSLAKLSWFGCILWMMFNIIYELYWCPVLLDTSFDIQNKSQASLVCLINKAFLPAGLPLTGRLLFSCTILCNLCRRLCVKIPVDQQVLKYSNHPFWHQQPCNKHFSPL